MTASKRPRPLGASAPAPRAVLPTATAAASGQGRFPLSLDAVTRGPAVGGIKAPVAKPGHTLRPQGPLAHAAEHRQRDVTPSGVGLDSEGVRARMVQRLSQNGVTDERVLQAFASVPRHQFVDPALVNQAYEDTSLPIGLGQTISKPSVVGRMLCLLMGGHNAQAQGHLGQVLEVGTGCGYQAAVLAQLSPSVVSIERLKALHEKARGHLRTLRLTRVRLHYGDGMLGVPTAAPYDSIIAAAGGEALPEAWLQQMKLGARLVAPVLTPDRQRQVLVVVDRHASGWTQTTHEVVQFVPLKSGTRA